MQVWSIFENEIELGVAPEIRAFTNFQMVCTTIGQEGRNRQEIIIPIDLQPGVFARLRAGEKVQLEHAVIRHTLSGNPKLRQIEETQADSFIAIIRTPFGYRGDNEHTGDLDEQGNALPFPGEIIARGRIADGNAGRMAQGEHLLAVIPLRTVFRARIGGRRYGKPEQYFYFHDGQQLYAFTEEERRAADIF